uniref:Uncharacterized protein n=1 Tax=Anguilla anguilla TaxID=7936 RepID=A0A0E9XKA3_ANGAN
MLINSGKRSCKKFFKK